MDSTTNETIQKTSLLSAIIARLNDPSPDRYSAIIGQRTFGRVQLNDTKAPSDQEPHCGLPRTQAKPSFSDPAKHMTKLAS